MLPVVDYDRLLPAEFDQRQASAPVAYQPIGCMEWHCNHLPLGNDGLKAHMLARRTAIRYGGIVLPPMHMGIHFPVNLRCYHQQHNLYISQDLMRRWVTEVFEQLYWADFRVIVLWTGHFPSHQGKFLRELAQELVFRTHSRCRVIVPDESAVAQALNTVTDHAGPWETSLLMELCPELVHMDRLDCLDGISPGMDPRKDASLDLGRRACVLWEEQVGKAVNEALRELGLAPVETSQR